MPMKGVEANFKLTNVCKVRPHVHDQNPADADREDKQTKKEL